MYLRNLTLLRNKFSSRILQSNYENKNYLAFLRIGIAMIAIADFLTMGSDIKLFFSETETIIPQELTYLFTEYFDELGTLYTFLENNGLTTIFYSNVGWIYILVLVLLGLGFFTRISAFIAIVLQLIIFKSFALFNFGYDHFLTMSLFYCLIFPVGKVYSIDKKLFPNKSVLKNSFNYQSILRIHLSIVYLFAGLAKVVSITWWNGEAIWRSMSSIYDNLFQIPPILLATIGISTVIIELGYPFLIAFKKTRKLILALVIMMHLGIAFMMQLSLFGAIMIMLNLTAFYQEIFSYKAKPINKLPETVKV